MTEQVLVTHDCAVGIGRPTRPEKKNGLTPGFSPLAARSRCRSRVEDAMQAPHDIAALPAGAVALLRTRLRGDSNHVVKRIDVETTLHFKERPQPDETRAAITAFLSRKM